MNAMTIPTTSVSLPAGLMTTESPRESFDPLRDGTPLSAMSIPVCGVTSTPFFSIITPAFNGAATLGALHESLEDQTETDFEWIVIDGGSRDGTTQLLESWSVPWLSWQSEPDTGIYAAMNKGVVRARGVYLLFLGCDDALAGVEVLAQARRKLVEFKGVDALIGLVQINGRKIFRSSIGAKTLVVNSIHHQGAFYARDLFKSFRYDEACRVAADYELNLILYMQRRKIRFMDSLVSCCGDAGASQTTDEFQVYGEIHQLRSRHLPRMLSAALLVVGQANVLRRRYLA